MCWDNLYQFGARLGTIVYSHKPTQGTRLDGASYILQNPFYDETIVLLFMVPRFCWFYHSVRINLDQIEMRTVYNGKETDIF